MNSPAILFYTSDFLTGVIDMTMEERGQYITLLCYQHQKGHIEEKTIRLLVGYCSDTVMRHFIKDEDDKFYNKRMDEEKRKREFFVESRRENGSLGGRPITKKEKPSAKPLGYHMDNHMGNDNDNENINDNIYLIISYLNNKLNTNYKYNNKNTIKHIKARLSEGFKENDFKLVIDKKITEWKNTDMEKYLRPETLFGTKFESYLNQPKKQTNNIAPVPEWLGKEIEIDQATEKEQKEMKKLLEEE